jgi:hypothetical protein
MNHQVAQTLMSDKLTEVFEDNNFLSDTNIALAMNNILNARFWLCQ